jgi:hypothetical protein
MLALRIFEIGNSSELGRVELFPEFMLMFITVDRQQIGAEDEVDAFPFLAAMVLVLALLTWD